MRITAKEIMEQDQKPQSSEEYKAILDGLTGRSRIRISKVAVSKLNAIMQGLLTIEDMEVTLVRNESGSLQVAISATCALEWNDDRKSWLPPFYV